MTGALLVGRGYGRVVGIRVHAADVAAVREHLPFWWADDPGEPEQVWTLPSGEPPQPLVRAMELWVAEHAVGFVFVHAGVVTFDGYAILLPGRSMSGKTTLVAALLRAGAGYCSDEYAVLDPHGLVHPYPRPLSIRGVDGVRRADAAGFGAITATSPAAVRTVAALTYRRDAGWSARPVGRAAAAMQLLDNAVAARSATARALEAVTAAVDGTTCVHGERGEADQAVGPLVWLHHG